MEGQKLRIYYTTDTHGSLPALCDLAADYRRGEDCLVIDGGDSLQGSALCYFFQRYAENFPQNPVAELFNSAGYGYFTLGNHDFNFGLPFLRRFLREAEGTCLCANVEGLEGVEKTALLRLPNGLTVGLTGAVTDYILIWEKPEHLEGLRITDPVEAVTEALDELRRAGADLTVCIYHGGFEADLDTGRKLTERRENQGYRICRELDFDLLLSGHQHRNIPGREVCGTYVVQTGSGAQNYIELEAEFDGAWRFRSALRRARGSGEPPPVMRQVQEAFGRWLDAPRARLSRSIPPQAHIDMAVHGSALANFGNNIRREISGAEVSALNLPRGRYGLCEALTLRDALEAFPFSNILLVRELDGRTLRRYLEKCAEFFALDGEGRPCRSPFFPQPSEHGDNYDYISGVEYTIDLRRPVGSRVTELRLHGAPLADDERLRLCMNDYRAGGSGGFEFLRDCPIVGKVEGESMSRLVEYIETHGEIAADETVWAKVLW